MQNRQHSDLCPFNDLIDGERTRRKRARRTTALTKESSRWSGAMPLLTCAKMERGKYFDAAARAVVDGDQEMLRSLLEKEPALVTERSEAAHGATLLHYVAANGVENERQKSPPNAPEIAQLLLASGAEPDAFMDAYGRPATTLEMLVSSWPPFAQGVQEKLVTVLVHGGASVEGPASAGRPLTTALVFGYTRSAETLASLGAKADHLFAAAGLGNLGQVQSWFDADGSLRIGALGGYVPLKPGDEKAAPGDIVQEALHFAVTHGRREVAEYLLQRGASANGQVRGHHCGLPLLQSLFVHELEMAGWLLEKGADPELPDQKRGMSAKEHVQHFGPEAAKVVLNLE